MKPYTTLITLFTLWISILNINAQADSVFITGKVYDYNTQEILGNAIFIHNGDLVKLSDEGDFNRYIKPGDTLSFRYTGHENYTIIVDEDLDKLSYITGIFLNQQEVTASDFILKPRLHNAKSFASYDPLAMEQMMKNAQHTVDVASYQANQAHEWDAHDNQKYSMSLKEEAIEYKAAIAPSQQIGATGTASIYDPIKTMQLKQKINAQIQKEKTLTAEEEFYLKTLFLNRNFNTK